MTTNDPSSLLAALDEFEKSLETPVVPGELEDWCQAAKQAWDQVAPQLQPEIAEAHEQVFGEISEQDPALVTRVEEMRETDQDLLRRGSELETKIDKLCAQASAVEPQESLLSPRVRKFTDEGLAFVIDIRKQEQALKTWYQEAFDRDRGTAD